MKIQDLQLFTWYAPFQQDNSHVDISPFSVSGIYTIFFFFSAAYRVLFPPLFLDTFAQLHLNHCKCVWMFLGGFCCSMVSEYKLFFFFPSRYTFKLNHFRYLILIHSAACCHKPLYLLNWGGLSRAAKEENRCETMAAVSLLWDNTVAFM